ncbi:MAG: histidine kinase dimerization/phospho-acceptor domain-containing protein [Anaerolineae bacterium]|nr:histidine kinase dimerization/phospho-acceptor domain-containing protein [Anaerolineae bacterium]
MGLAAPGCIARRSRIPTRDLSKMARKAQSYPETTEELGGTLHIKTIPLEPGYQGSLTILHDITHFKLVDKIVQLITDISHELRTPMSALKLYGELIRISPPEKREAYIEQILHL